MTKEKQAQKQKYFSVKAGFSLVEVLIALLILTMGITALVAMLAKNNKEIIATRDQLIATNLAQEGAELVRNNWDNDNTSSYFDNDSDNYILIFSSYNSYNIQLANWSDKKLYWVDNKQYADGMSATVASDKVDTKFARKIKFTKSSQKLDVFVWWTDNGAFPATCNLASKCVQVTTYFSADGSTP